ncbi:uncharacterized protein B0H18DRAFT_332855 [Fomitopsis serialis]|uniref:uncharacterized protein n=1 Tax=Fomitopsis serialis TaxID=139415 RepID=UPI002007DFBE|nr:uncharacterized protein B0H18DRAFT_332855 [Neoantrodia serialis]KAH9926787.1 hypothetical protein B0H18DRAFT_332855 [Neoantrodia serialis]
MQHIVLSVGRSTSSPETSEIAAVPRSLLRALRARLSALLCIKTTARDKDADEATSNGRGVARGEDHTVRGEGDVARDEGESEIEYESYATDDGLEPLATDISDRIPIEIYEKIIEHMDRSTLPNASLVSRAWYPRATFQLYHTIVIARRARYDLLVEQLRTSSRVQRWLQSTHKVVLGYDTRGQPWFRAGIPFLDAFPLVFGHACPSLQVLDIRWILRPNMHPTFHRALRQFQHITALRLHHIELSNIAQLRRIVHAVMSLEELVLDNLSLSQPQLPDSAGARFQDDPFRGPCNIRLKRLRVEANDNRHIKAFGRIAYWLACSGICSSLIELVTFFDGETVLATEPVNRLLEVSAQSLTSFHCQSHLELRDRSPWTLVHNTALRQLTLGLNFNPYGPTEDSDWACAASELRGAFSTVRSYQLEHIAVHFKFQLFDPPNEDNFGQDWKQLDSELRSLHDVMVRPYFEALRDVKVEMEVVYNPDRHSKKSVDDFASAMASSLRRLFMPWHDRGILAIITT